MSVPFQNVMEKLRHFKLVVDDRGTEDDKKMINRILFAVRSKHYRTAYTLFVAYFDRGMRGVMNDFHFPADRPTFELLFETLIHGQHLGQYFSSVVDCGTEEDKEILSRIMLAQRKKDYQTVCDLIERYFNRSGRGLQLDSNFAAYRSNIESFLYNISQIRDPHSPRLQGAAELAVGGPLPSTFRTFMKREGLIGPPSHGQSLYKGRALDT